MSLESEKPKQVVKRKRDERYRVAEAIGAGIGQAAAAFRNQVVQQVEAVQNRRDWEHFMQYLMYTVTPALESAVRELLNDNHATVQLWQVDSDRTVKFLVDTGKGTITPDDHSALRRLMARYGAPNEYRFAQKETKSGSLALAMFM